MRAVEESRLREDLARFIFDQLLELPYDGEDPLADEMVDSLGQEQLAEYIGETYGVELTDEDMAKENFESLPALSALVAAKLASER